MLCHIWEPLQQFRKFASHSEHICLTPPRPSVRCQESGEGLPATHMYPPLKSSKGLKPYSLSWKKNNLLYIQNTCSIYIYMCVCVQMFEMVCVQPLRSRQGVPKACSFQSFRRFDGTGTMPMPFAELWESIETTELGRWCHTYS